jgi:hypothetical protein
VIVLKSFGARLNSKRQAEAYATGLLQCGATVLAPDVWRDGLGNVIAVRQGGGDCWEVCELSQLEGLQARRDFCLSEARRFAERAARWPASHPLAAYAWRDNAEWLAKAEIVSGQIEAAEAAEKGRAA